jgi:hypothetical protein
MPKRLHTASCPPLIMASAQEVVNSVAGGLKKLVKSTGEQFG